MKKKGNETEKDKERGENNKGKSEGDRMNLTIDNLYWILRTCTRTRGEVVPCVTYLSSRLQLCQLLHQRIDLVAQLFHLGASLWGEALSNPACIGSDRVNCCDPRLVGLLALSWWRKWTTRVARQWLGRTKKPRELRASRGREKYNYEARPKARSSLTTVEQKIIVMP